VPRLQRLAKFYNVPVDQLLPRVTGSDPGWTGSADLDERAWESDSKVDDEGPITIDLTRLEAEPSPEKDLLSRYLGMIQVQRQDFNGRVLTIRREDMRAIACLLETNMEGMRRRLDEMGLRL
jgi:hypothetical protein